MFPSAASLISSWPFDLVWAIGICWTWIDSRRRLGRSLERLALAPLGIVPIAGPLLYTLLRPNDTFQRRRDRARMRIALERMVTQPDQARRAERVLE